MSKSNEYLAHFSDVNLGASRDGVLSCHLSSDLPNFLYENVVNEFPLPISSEEKKRHLKALIEYAAYAKSANIPNFFYWYTACPCPPETSPLAEAGGDSFYKIPCSDCGGESLHHHNYGFIFCDGCAALAATDFFDCQVCGDNLHDIASHEGVCSSCNCPPTADDIPPCLGGAL